MQRLGAEKHSFQFITFGTLAGYHSLALELLTSVGEPDAPQELLFPNSSQIKIHNLSMKGLIHLKHKDIFSNIGCISETTGHLK